MKGFLRRLRGIIGMAVTWAVAGAGLLTGLGLVLGAGVSGVMATLGAFMGFLSGGAFGVMLSIVERRKRLEDLSLWRMALWGGFGGFVMAGGLTLIYGRGLLWGFMTTIAVTGAVISTGTVAIARRADRKLLEGDDDLPALEGE